MREIAGPKKWDHEWNHANDDWQRFFISDDFSTFHSKNGILKNARKVKNRRHHSPPCQSCDRVIPIRVAIFLMRENDA